MVAIFLGTWIPWGGSMIRYPALEKILFKVAREDPNLYQSIHENSNPSSLCGVKAVLEYRIPSFLNYSENHFTLNQPSLSFSVFRLANDFLQTKIEEEYHRFFSPHTADILIPPPRLLL